MNRSVNLMSQAEQRRQIAGQAIRVWARVLAATASLGLLACLGASWTASEAVQRRDALDARHEPIKQMRVDIQRLRTQIKDLNQRERVAIDLASGSSVAALLGWIGRAAKETDGEVYIAEFKFTRNADDATKSEAAILTLTGKGRSATAVTRFVDWLREADLFQEIELTSTQSDPAGPQAMTAFGVRCRL